MADDKVEHMENAFRNFSITLFRMTSRLFGQVLLRHRRLVVIFLQMALILSANVTAFLLRFEGDIPPIYLIRLVQGLPFVALVYGIGLWIFGLQRGLWRYVGLHDLT